jgi:oligopeptide/dipeptide ABC transporter ATP-binding protein
MDDEKTRVSADGKLLTVSDLTTAFFTGGQTIKAVDSVSFQVHKGEIFGLVGESGCGKTMTALSLMRLVPLPGRITEGAIFFEDRDLLSLSVQEMEKVRGGRIGMIFQEPMTALNPVFRVGDQIAETLLAHKDLTGKEAKEQTEVLLKTVGFDMPEKKYMQYPHQLSGGQRQRILIAIAIACNPSLVIADEPTTALDVATESQILYFLRKLVMDYRMSMIFITHNLNIIRRLGRRIGIMYAGRMLEQGYVDDFFNEPLHPYSKGLLGSVFTIQGDEKRLNAIPGFVPKLSDMPSGCKFHPRCGFVMPKCRIKEPQMTEMGNERWVRCYLFHN